MESNHGSNIPTPDVSVSAPSIPSGYHEMPAEPMADRRPASMRDPASPTGLAELPATINSHFLAKSRPRATTTHGQPSGARGGAVELPASPTATSSQHLRRYSEHQRRSSSTQAQADLQKPEEELDSMEFSHRDLGVALPPITLGKTSRRASNLNSKPLPALPPALSTPLEFADVSRSTGDDVHRKLQAATSSRGPNHSRRTSSAALPYPADNEPGRSRRTSGAALPYPEDNGSVLMPLHWDYTHGHEKFAQGLR